MLVDAKRLAKGQRIERCEAISQNGPNAGYQCGLRAVTLKDGRPACHSHSDVADKSDWIDAHDPRIAYEILEGNLFKAAQLDAGIAEVIRSVAASMEGWRD